MITESLISALTFLCIAFGTVLVLSFVFYWGYKFAYYEENKELNSLRKEVNSKEEQILGLRSQLNRGHHHESK